MQNPFFRKTGMATLALVTAISTTMATPSQAADSKGFVVTDVSFSGLKRLTPESLYTILPISVGSQVNSSNLAESIKALYASQNFSNVQANVHGSTIEFFVVERPIIAEVNVEGNKLIPTEGLKEGLSRAGISEGSLLKQSTLVNVAQELQQQYVQQGYYNSDIDVDQALIDGNRANVDIKFTEGKPAEVVDIKIIGNSYFSDKDIKDVLAIKESSWKTLLSKSDRFAQEKLKASLESIKALYLNEGFVRFNIDNSVINVSDDKQSVYIELSISEGKQYTFGTVNFLGQHTFDNQELQDLVSFNTADQYNQSEMDATSSALKYHFGNKGFYYAKIRPVQQIDDVSHKVDVDFYLDPARPIYVRRINFSGHTKTQDEVLRREMRQLEGALSSNKKIELSRTRLMRTGYFKTVNVEVKPVPNKPDQVDVNFVVEEQPTGSSTIAAGYSQSGGVTFQLDMSQRNFIGSGNSVNASMSRSETRDSYSLGYTDPYFNENGVSQSVSGYYRKTKNDDKNISNYVTDSMGATLRYGYPVDENIRVSGGLNIDSTDITGGRWMAISNVDQLIDDGGKVTKYKDAKGNITNYNFKKDYNSYNFLLGWSYNDLDKPVFPTDGMNHSVDVKLGFGDRNYQKATYKGSIYQPIYKDIIARGYAKLGYGNDLPFYENFYAGGYGSVRGYDASSLGPKSMTFYDASIKEKGYKHEEVGGNALASFGAEVILPIPFKGDWAQQIRPVLFVEGGQVFDTSGRDDENFMYEGVELPDVDNKPISLITQDNEFRYSAGAGMTWYTPIGPISLSYSVPFNDQKGDSTEKVQFQIGNTF